MRLRAGLAFYVAIAIWGVLQCVAADSTVTYYLASLIVAFLATNWAVVDSRTRASGFVAILQCVYFFTWPIASLVYLVATRGIRGIGWWLIHAVGLLVTVCLTFYPTFYLLYWFGWIDPNDFILLN